MTLDGTTPDVLIVGGGPAGSTLATLLARGRWKVVLVDRAEFPRPKPCGEFLSPGTLQAMNRLQLPYPTGRGGRLEGWSLRADGAEVHTRFSSGLPGASLPRVELDAHLLAQSRIEGAQVIEGATYLDGTPGVGPPAVRVRTRQGIASMKPKILVGAGGLRCPVSRALSRRDSPHPPRKISLTAHLQGLDLDPHVGSLVVRDELTVGFAPSDPAGRRWNVTVVAPRTWGRRLANLGPRAFYLECLESVGMGQEGLAAGETPLASSGFRNPVARTFAGRTVLIGDAQGYYDPFTGQGIYQAIRSAELLAPYLHLGLAGREPWSQALRGYDRRVTQERRSTQRLQRAVEAWLASGALRSPLSHALSRVPGLFATIMEATTDRSSILRALRHRARPLARPAGTVAPDAPAHYPRAVEREAVNP